MKQYLDKQKLQVITMEFTFGYELSRTDREEYLGYYNLLALKAIEQHPSWPLIENAGVRYSYFVARKETNIVCTAVIAENKSKLFPVARLQFGPLFNNVDELLFSLQALIKHFREKKYMLFTIQLAMATGYDADFIEYQLNRDFRLVSYYDRDNWSSLQLDLNKEEDEVFRSFSKGHKSDIKKAIKNNLRVSDGCSEQEWTTLMEVFVKMNQRRGMAKENNELLNLLTKVRLHFESENAGIILVVRDKSEKIIGGILLAYQGETVRYFKGAADPDQRHLPVLHLAIWEGIKRAKLKGFKIFDFWGYNHFVTQEDQVFLINRFKKGFGGDYSFYPKKMYVIYKPWKYKMYIFLKRVSRILYR